MSNTGILSNLHAQNSSRQLVVRARTGSGEWAGVYLVSPDGSCRLWSRQTRWEPLKAIRARVSASLGRGEGVRS